MRTCLVMTLVLATATANAAEPPAATVAELLQQLRDKDAVKRLHAAAALADLGSKAKSALPALTKALDDPHRMVRFYAVQAIDKVGGDLTPAVTARLLKIVKADESWIVARQAAMALGRREPGGRWAEAILVQRPGQGRFLSRLEVRIDAGVREPVAGRAGGRFLAPREVRLKKHLPLAVSEMRAALLRETSPPQQLLLLYLMRRTGARDAESIASYVNVVRTAADPRVRSEAAKLIGVAGKQTPGAVKPLFAALESEKSPAVKLQIVLALRRCVKKNSPARPLLRKLAVEYSRQIALATLRDIIRRQTELTKDTRRLNARSVLGLEP